MTSSASRPAAGGPPAAPAPAALPVLVIGAGVRAAALARALSDAGRPVTVREPDGAPPPVPPAPPESPVPSPPTASTVPPALLVLLCAETPEDAERALAAVPGALPAVRGLVNLTSVTADQGRRAAERATALGLPYLQGALMAHPGHVGRSDTVLVYSGSAEVFDEHRGVLRELGSATFLGTDAGLAPLYDVALLAFAWAALTGFLHTAALLTADGVRAGTVAPLLTQWLGTTVTEVITDYAAQIDAGEYPGDEEWLELDAPLMDHLIQASRERGLDTGLPALIRELTHRGIAAGHGGDSYASLIGILRAATGPDGDAGPDGAAAPSGAPD